MIKEIMRGSVIVYQQEEIALLWAVIEEQNTKINSLEQQLRGFAQCLELRRKNN